MPRKPKPPVEKPPMHDRLVRIWHSHPLISIGTVVSIATLISITSPWIGGFLKDFETVEQAKQRDAAIRAIISAHQARDAWGALQGIRNEQVAARNRVNDCDIKKDKPQLMSELERSVCLQYRQEFDEVTRRYNDALQTAKEMSKEKP